MSALQGYSKRPEIQKKYFEDRLAHLKVYQPAFEVMLQEPLLLDDGLRTPVDQFMVWLVTTCETLICLDDKTLVGICSFASVVPGRRAECIAWLNPAYRGPDNLKAQKIVKEFITDDILDYAWKDLGLQKITVKVAVENEPSLALVKNIGFELCGTLHQDIQIFGRLHDSFIFELLNPALTVEPIEERIHGGKRTVVQPDTAAVDSELPAADDESAGESASPEPDDDEPLSDNAERERRRLHAAFVSPNEQFEPAFFQQLG